jgi:hypothetical protein
MRREPPAAVVAAAAATNPPAVRQKNIKRFYDAANACKNIWLLEDAGFFFSVTERLYVTCSSFLRNLQADPTAQFFQATE